MNTARDLALDANGDLLIVGQDLAPLLVDEDAIISAISAVTKCVAGEWFLDSTVGIQWLTIFGSKGLSTAGIQTILFNKYVVIPGVAQVLSVVVTLNRQLRLAQVAWQIRADAGKLLAGTVTAP